MWITIGVWFVAVALFSSLAPSPSDYKVSSVENLLPKDAQSVIAESKVNEYFAENEGIPAILVFEATNGEITFSQLVDFVNQVEEANVQGLKEIIPLGSLPPQVADTFLSDDKQAALIPATFAADLDTKEIKIGLEEIYALAEKQTDVTLYVTGPAGIAVDTSDLFSRADLVLIFSSVGIILILLIITYRSPLLALIPLLAVAFVHQVVNHTLGLMGKAGLELASQSLSIMMILLIAVIIDYSLFVFSRFQEELRQHDNKYESMRLAMREVGIPIFFSGSTILAAMLILFFTKFGDYFNFAAIFATAVFIVMIASITLIPALFTLFGRTAFWPKIPRVGDEHIKHSSFWGKVGRFVSQRPVFSVVIIGAFLLLSASNIFNLNYEFDTMKSFPEDMPSRQGYDILESEFAKGDLAPTTVLFESKEETTADERETLLAELVELEYVSEVRVSDVSEDEKVVAYSLTFTEGPYDVATMDKLEELMTGSMEIVAKSNVNGELSFAGETASSVDYRSVSNRDLIVIVILETILIFGILIFLTNSYRLPIYMVGTILLSYVAALGLGVFLVDLLFDIGSVSNRVPVYAFVFLVALGIDYNIFLVSRFMEERKKHPVREAVAIAVANTGGVISSAGIVLAATFAVLMTQPVEDLFVFGFIVALGILLDTFLIRGVLMPGILVLFEKNEHIRLIRRRKK